MKTTKSKGSARVRKPTRITKVSVSEPSTSTTRTETLFLDELSKFHLRSLAVTLEFTDGSTLTLQTQEYVISKPATSPRRAHDGCLRRASMRTPRSPLTGTRRRSF